MKPPAFDYEVAVSVDDTLEKLRREGDDAKILAGGQSLLPLLNYRLARPSLLIDINRIPRLADVAVRTDCVTFGALVRHRKLETSATVAQYFPLLREAAQWIAHPQIRTRGTLGGSLAHSDAAAELPVVLMALDASVVVSSIGNERSLAIEDLVVGHFVSSLANDEMITAVTIPMLPERTGTAFTEFARRHGDYAIGGAAAVISLDESGKCSRARVTLLGAGSTALRSSAAETALLGRSLDDAAVSRAAQLAVEGINPTPNNHGDASYRRNVIAAMVARAVGRATERARNAE